MTGAQYQFLKIIVIIFGAFECLASGPHDIPTIIIPPRSTLDPIDQLRYKEIINQMQQKIKDSENSVMLEQYENTWISLGYCEPNPSTKEKEFEVWDSTTTLLFNLTHRGHVFREHLQQHPSQLPIIKQEIQIYLNSLKNLLPVNLFNTQLITDLEQYSADCKNTPEIVVPSEQPMNTLPQPIPQPVIEPSGNSSHSLIHSHTSSQYKDIPSPDLQKPSDSFDIVRIVGISSGIFIAFAIMCSIHIFVKHKKKTSQKPANPAHGFKAVALGKLENGLYPFIRRLKSVISWGSMNSSLQRAL